MGGIIQIIFTAFEQYNINYIHDNCTIIFYNFNIAIITLIIFGVFYLLIFLLLRKKTLY